MSGRRDTTMARVAFSCSGASFSRARTRRAIAFSDVRAVNSVHLGRESRRACLSGTGLLAPRPSVVVGRSTQHWSSRPWNRPCGFDDVMGSAICPGWSVTTTPDRREDSMCARAQFEAR